MPPPRTDESQILEATGFRSDNIWCNRTGAQITALTGHNNMEQLLNYYFNIITSVTGYTLLAMCCTTLFMVQAMSSAVSCTVLCTLVQIKIALAVHVALSIQNGMTPLMKASFEGHVDVVRLLIEAKAQINTRRKVLNSYQQTIHIT